MTPQQLEAEWRRVFPGKRSPTNKRKVREMLAGRVKPKMTPEEFRAEVAAKRAERGPVCRHGIEADHLCAYCEAEQVAIKQTMQATKCSEADARRALNLPASPGPVVEVAAVPSKPLAPVTPEVESPEQDRADDLVGPVPTSFEAEIAEHKARKRR